MTRGNAATIARFAAPALAAVMLASTARPAAAQTPASAAPAAPRHWEFAVASGRMIQTGAQRDAVRDGNMSAAQVWYAVTPALAVTGTGGWARSQNRLIAGRPKRDLFTYDIGAEFRAPTLRLSRSVTIKPLVGAGLGGHTQNDRGLDAPAMNDLAVYGGGGVEIGVRRVALRIEARNYAIGGNTNVAILTGLRFRGK